MEGTSCLFLKTLSLIQGVVRQCLCYYLSIDVFTVELKRVIKGEMKRRDKWFGEGSTKRDLLIGRR
jgi:hypothetical protein